MKTIKRSENKNRKVLTSFAFLLFITLFFNGSVSKASNPENKKCIITGKVTETKTNSPLEYANIALYSSLDSTLITGTITDTTGNFQLKKIENGSYFIETSFLGYKKKVSEIFKVEDEEYQFGSIHLELDFEVLEAISVTATQNAASSLLDKKIVNVDKNLTAIGGMAVDALRNAPLITTDADDNILLRGSADFKVLINGKPTFLSPDEVLRQTPADIIKNIEIITNPSVKYSSEGTAGIINIILKSELKQGFNGQLDYTAGSNNKFSYGGTVNLNTKKLRLTAGLEWRDYTTTAENDYERYLFNDDYTDVAWLYQDRTHKSKNFGVRFNADYSLTEKTNISYSLNTGYTSFGADMSHNTHEYTIPADTNIYTANTFSLGIKPTFFTNNLTWSQEFDKTGTELNATAYYSHIKYVHYNYRTSVNADNTFTPIDDDIYKLNIDNHNFSNDYRLDLDVTQPIGKKSKLETGFSYHGYKRNIDVVFTEFNNDYPSGTTILDYTNKFDFTENIIAGYLSYNLQLPKFNLTTGIRAENTNRKLVQLTNQESYPYKKWHFFPSVSVNKSFDEKHSLSLNYSHRINRPDEYMMNPFPESSDDYFFSTGNPFLLPETSHNLEIGFRKIIEKGAISAQLYYNTTTDKMDQSLTMLEDNRIYIIMENNRKDRSVGSDFMINYQIKPWWSINSNVSLSDYNIKGTIQQEYLKRQNFQWNANLVSSFNFKSNTSFQIIGMYNSKTVRLQSELSDYYMVNLAINQMIGKRISMNFQIKDVLQSLNYELYTEQDNMQLTGYFKNESPVVLFSFRYVFNNFKKMTKDVETKFDMGM